jgi:hypothetical protein
MHSLLDSSGREIEKGQRLKCVVPDSKSRLDMGRVYHCAGRRNNIVALKGIPHSFAGWRFTIVTWSEECYGYVPLPEAAATE